MTLLKALVGAVLAPRRAQAVPADPEALFRRGNQSQANRRFAEADGFYAEADRILAARGNQWAVPRAQVLNQRGLARLRAADPEGADQWLRMAADLSPQDPSMQGCARFPALMSRTTGLPVVPHRLAPTAPPGPECVLDVGYFFVGTAQGARFEEYCKLLRSSIRAARRNVPNARISILTDRGTPLTEQLGADHVVRTDLPEGIMLARLSATRAWLEAPALAGQAFHALLCDPDTLLLRDPRPAFGTAFDVGLVERSDFVEARLDHEPFIAGVAFASGERPGQAARWFRLCEEWLPVIADWPEVAAFYPRPIREWRGDQVVPAALVGWRTYAEHVLSRSDNAVAVEGVRVGFLPSDPYCHPFQPGMSDRELGARTVLDFKGARKAYQLNEGARIAGIAAGEGSS